MTAPRFIRRNTKKALAERGPSIHDGGRGLLLDQRIHVLDRLDEIFLEFLHHGACRFHAVDQANTLARADVVIDGVVILTAVPVTTLLFLERKLVDLHTFVAKLPVLDPAERWTYNGEVGAYASAPSETIRSKKVMRNHVRYEATEKHPAQVDVYNEDVPEGTWTTVKYSGALPADRVAVLMARVTKMTQAVKQARELANTTPVEDVALGSPFFTYLFGPSPA